MFNLFRIVFALGLIGSMGYALSYLLTGEKSQLITAARILIVMLVVGVLLLIGIYLEHMFG